MNTQMAALIEVLLDTSAREDERDDAAMDLADFDDSKALEALCFIGSNPQENQTVLDSCGTSIGEILMRQTKHDLEILKKLAPIAKSSALAYINAQMNE
ncbi:MAG: hypothetical protein S4CHLAM81_12040 [Chlamydiales bacterium]|nr:hypothetical protein [Chlamydiales bacterium]MCH9635980.1 hypothetical protein [Chlamydiales bacterium]MCH9703889.1 hypothetical protein [Chlamydiota bacterium]